MNILLWVVQVLLAVWDLIGGSFVVANYDKVKGAWAAGLPASVGMAYGLVQILLAIGLLAPKQSRFAAMGLVVWPLLGCALFAAYAGFPGCLWGVIPALIAAFIAYGRFVLKPL